jgi:hypothetical protein
VLLVCGDEFPLAPLTAHADGIAPTHALAVLLGASGEGSPVELALESGPLRRALPVEPDELAFARWWQSELRDLALDHEPRRWTLRR